MPASEPRHHDELRPDVGLTEPHVEHYLQRIGVSWPASLDLDGLEILQRAHLTTVPFENLFVAEGHGVRTDVAWSFAKIVEQGRGGWCFELNGAFAALLEALGFTVRRLGAAVIRRGPSDVIDHLTLEVSVRGPGGFGPHLVDVGFGDTFIRPLDLNAVGPQDGGVDDFEFVASPRGTTLVRHGSEGPAPELRFKRVSLTMSDFDPASEHLQAEEGGFFTGPAFATRLLFRGPDRVTLRGGTLKLVRGGQTDEKAVPAEQWEEVLSEWFALTPVRGGRR